MIMRTALVWLLLACIVQASSQHPPELDDDAVHIPILQQIILRGHDSSYFAQEEMRQVDWVDIAVPGSSQILRSRLNVFVNQLITAETLEAIKKTIVDYYTREGYPFVAVRVPEQKVTSGVLQLVVIESRLGEFFVEGNQYAPTAQIRRYFSIKPGDLINENRLLQTVSFINRNPFRRADLVFAPGKEKGTTDVILATKDRSPFRIYAGTDNQAVQVLGPSEWYTGFNWGNAFGLDHILSYQFTASYDPRRFQAHTAEYIALCSWGHVLDIYGGYSETHPPISPPFKRNDGWSLQTSARYVIPLKIYPYLEHEIFFGGDFKRTNNTFEFTEQFPVFGKNVNLTQAVLGYSGNYERNNYRLDFKGSVFYSPGKWIADQTNADYASLRPGAVNQWVYGRAYFVYLQRLPKSFSLSLRAIGQGSTHPLLPSEQFGLGGYDTVRGYEEREFNVDQAVVLSGELRSPAMRPLKWIKPTVTVHDGLQFLVFYDYGWGDDITTIPAIPKAVYLMGAGPGVRYTIEPYLTGRVDWGVRLHNNAAFPGHWNRIHFSVTASY